MIITTILPVSRPQYLDRVLESLANQTLKPQNLLVIYDGPEGRFIDVRNKVAELNIDNRLCVQSDNPRLAFSIPDRRRHIVNIHNHAKELVENTDWVFCVEDDGVLPPNALLDLVGVVNDHKDTGIVTGVELGRWGVPYVGAWIVDNINDVQNVESVENKTSCTTLEEIDACGLYCALVRADGYKQHNFFTSNGLGPDVNLGLYLRQQGFKNYINWGVHVTHLTSSLGVEIEIPATDTSRRVKLKLLSENTWQSYR
jgi:glycosyltransferase involved in cell wall biosynthesis